MSQIISVQQHSSDMSAILREECKSYSIPVIREDELGKLEFWATGFFIELDGLVFFITASHVVSQRAQLYVTAPNKSLFKLPQNGYHTGEGSLSSNDIAYIKVESNLPNQLGVKIFKKEDFLIRGGEFKAASYYLIGYPVSKNKTGKAIKAGTKEIKALGFATKLSKATINFAKYGKSEESHIAISYGQLLDKNLEKTNHTKLNGMSGCPIWLTKSPLVSEPKWLVGMLIEYHNKSESVIIGTKISAIISFIRGTRCFDN